MTDIAFDTTDHGAAIRLGAAGLYWLAGAGLAALLFLAGLNFVVANAMQGLVAVLGG